MHNNSLDMEVAKQQITNSINSIWLLIYADRIKCRQAKQ